MLYDLTAPSLPFLVGHRRRWPLVGRSPRSPCSATSVVRHHRTRVARHETIPTYYRHLVLATDLTPTPPAPLWQIGACATSTSARCAGPTSTCSATSTTSSTSTTSRRRAWTCSAPTAGGPEALAEGLVVVRHEVTYLRR